MFDDSEITDYDLMRLADRFEAPVPAPWHPVDGVPRYYGMVFYWFDREDFNIRIPLSVVNFGQRGDDVPKKFYIRWGGMNYKGAFCIVVQDPSSISKTLPKPDLPSTWRYYSRFCYRDSTCLSETRSFPDRTKMRWGYINIASYQIFLRWWHTAFGALGVAKMIDGFTFTGKYYLKEWPFKDPLYPLYQRVVAQLVKKDWQPQGSYFDLRKM